MSDHLRSPTVTADPICPVDGRALSVHHDAEVCYDNLWLLAYCGECEHERHDGGSCEEMVDKHNGYAPDSGYRIDGEGPCDCAGDSR